MADLPYSVPQISDARMPPSAMPEQPSGHRVEIIDSDNVKIDGAKFDRLFLESKASEGSGNAKQILAQLNRLGPGTVKAQTQVGTPMPQTALIQAPGMAGQSPAPTQSIAQSSQTYRPAQSVQVQGPVSTAERQHSPLAWQATGDVAAAMDEQRKARQSEMEVEAMAMEDQVAFAERKAQIARDATDRRADISNRLLATQKEYRAKRERVLSDTQAMSVQDFWGKHSTGSRIMAGIGLALGAAAQAYTKGPNPAMQIIDAAIMNDLEVQKANMAKGRARIEDLGGAYVQIMLDYDDEQKASDLFYAAALDQVNKQLDVVGAGAATDQMVQKVQGLKADFEAAKAEMIQRVALGEEREVRSTVETRYIPSSEQRRRDIDYEDYDKELYVKRAGGNARNATQASRLDDGYDSIDRMRIIFSQMSDLKKQIGNKELFGTQKNRMEGMVQNLSTELAVLKGLGAISKDDREIVEGISGGNTTDIFNFSSDNIKDLEDFTTRSEKVLQNKVNPVKSETAPSWAPKMQRHPWEDVYTNPTNEGNIKQLEQDLNAGHTNTTR